MTDAATAEKKDVVPSEYRDRYKETGGTCGDFIATNLQKIAKDGIDSLNSVKAENGIEAARWESFNHGMQRMNLANVLRGSYLKGDTIKLLGKEYNAKHQVEDYTGKVENNPKALTALATFLELQTNERTVTALGKLFFPPAPKGKTAEERAAEKAAKEAGKTAAKVLKDATNEAKKAKGATDKAKAKLDKAQTALNLANTAMAEAGKAQKAVKKDDEAGKTAADKAVAAASTKVGKLEDDVAKAETAHDAALGVQSAADAKVAELTKA